jgi:uncharacterized protein (UPF0332 family)
MFFAAEMLLASKDLSFSSHQAVIGAFGKEFAKTGILPSDMHGSLQHAFDDRNTNEYKFRPAYHCGKPPVITSKPPNSL